MELLFVHLLNNNTGSPRVLSNLLLNIAKDSNNSISLLSSRTAGLLSGLENVRYINNHYKWNNNKIILTIRLLYSQLYQFFYVLFGKKYDIVYINTLLPFGAALAAKIRKFKIIYHIHEYYENPNIMHRISIKIMEKTANKAIFVSDYLRNKYKFPSKIDCFVCHNSVSEFFYEDARNEHIKKNFIKQHYESRTVVMLSSLKKYKGIDEFFLLSEKLPDFKFLLVLSCKESELNSFLNGRKIGNNVEFILEPSSISEIYNNCFLCINLSHPYGESIWVETFGMTLLEANCYGVPVLAPYIGGPKEIVVDSYNGFLIDPYKIDDLKVKIEWLYNNFHEYERMSYNAVSVSENFKPEKFISNIMEIVGNL